MFLPQTLLWSIVHWFHISSDFQQSCPNHIWMQHICTIKRVSVISYSFKIYCYIYTGSRLLSNASLLIVFFYVYPVIIHVYHKHDYRLSLQNRVKPSLIHQLLDLTGFTLFLKILTNGNIWTFTVKNISEQLLCPLDSCTCRTYFLVPSREPPLPDQLCTSVQLIGFTCRQTDTEIERGTETQGH